MGNTIGNLLDQTFKKDHVYKQIGSWFLYDNHIIGDYLILCNRQQKTEPYLKNNEDGKEEVDFRDIPGEFSNDPFSYDVSKIANEIWQHKRNPTTTEELSDLSIALLNKFIKDHSKETNLVKLVEPLLFIKMQHNPSFQQNYHGYEVWFDETAHLDQVENIYDWDLAKEFIIGEGYGTTNRLYDWNVNSAHHQNIEKQQMREEILKELSLSGNGKQTSKIKC